MAALRAPGIRRSPRRDFPSRRLVRVDYRRSCNDLGDTPIHVALTLVFDIRADSRRACGSSVGGRHLHAYPALRRHESAMASDGRVHGCASANRNHRPRPARLVALALDSLGGGTGFAHAGPVHRSLLAGAEPEACRGCWNFGGDRRALVATVDPDYWRSQVVLAADRKRTCHHSVPRTPNDILSTRIKGKFLWGFRLHPLFNGMILQLSNTFKRGHHGVRNRETEVPSHHPSQAAKRH